MKIRVFKSINGIFPKEIHEEFERVFVNGEKLNKKFLSDAKYTSELSVNKGKDLKVKNDSQFEVAKTIADSLGGKSKLKTYNILLKTTKVVVEAYQILFLLVLNKEVVCILKRFSNKVNFNSIFQNDY